MPLHSDANIETLVRRLRRVVPPDLAPRRLTASQGHFPRLAAARKSSKGVAIISATWHVTIRYKTTQDFTKNLSREFA
jgi:hypothetical protein